MSDIVKTNALGVAQVPILFKDVSAAQDGRQNALAVVPVNASGAKLPSGTQPDPDYVLLDYLNGASYSATATGVLFTTDVSTFGTVGVQVSSIGSASNVITFEGSNDNITWATITTAQGQSSITSAVGLYQIPIAGIKYFRARVSTYVSGTVTVLDFYSSIATTQRVIALTAGSSSIGAIGTSAATGGILMGTPLISAATVNNTLVKASTGRLYGFKIFNASASTKFVKLFNKATAPVAGTDTPVDVIPVGAGTSVILMSDVGMAYSTGIGFAITANAALADNTAVAAGDVILTMYYA